MVKWCNKYGEMVQRIHTSSHGEMVKHTSGDILLAELKNGYTRLLWPSISRVSWIHQLLHMPSRLWVVPCWCYNCPTSPSNALQCHTPPLLLINTCLLYIPSATANTGGVVPFLNLLILAIVQCSFNGDILYYLCATLTYTTFTSDIWSPHYRFLKVYFIPL